MPAPANSPDGDGLAATARSRRRPAGGVDEEEPHSVLARDGAAFEEMVSLGGERAVGLSMWAWIRGVFELSRRGATPRDFIVAIGDVRIVRRRRPCPRALAGGGGGADAATADDGECAPAPARHTAGALVLNAIAPSPSLQPAIQESDSAGKGEHHPEGGVGDFFRAVIGHVDHVIPRSACRRAVDVVEPHAAADDQLAVFRVRMVRAPRAECDRSSRRGPPRFAPPAPLRCGVQRRDVGQVAQDAPLVIERPGDEIGDGDLGTLLMACKRCGRDTG